MHPVITEITEGDRTWLPGFLVRHWGSTQMVYSGSVHQLDQLPGFVARMDGEPVGLITYEIKGDQCQIVSLDSLRERHGIGSALMEAVERQALMQGVRRMWLITTNDNLNALRFYQKRGYVLVRIHRNAVEAARRLKPEIPLVGNDGIPIRDEIELEKLLVPVSG